MTKRSYRFYTMVPVMVPVNPSQTDMFNDCLLTPEMELELSLRERGMDNGMEPEQELNFEEVN